MINATEQQSITAGQQKRLWLDIIFVVVIFLPFAFFLTSTFSFNSFTSGYLAEDDYWYLNRAQLLGQPYLDQPFAILYAVMYPLAIRLMLILSGDIILAAILVNALSLFMVALGTYILGRGIYDRPVAWFASIFMLTLPYFNYIVRVRFVPYVFMTAILVWVLVAFWWFISRHDVWSAIFLGVMLSIGIYTRLEFFLYAGLLLPATYGVYRASQSKRRALLQVGIAGGILLLPALVLVNMLLDNAAAGADAGSTNFPFLLLWQNWPETMFIYGGRWADAITNTVGHAPWWVWLGTLVAIMWSLPQNRIKNWGLALFIPFNIFYVFILTGWPWPEYLTHSLPVVGLLCGVTLAGLMKHWSMGRVVYGVALILLFISAGGTVRPIIQSEAAVLGYRHDPILQEGAVVSQWLSDNGYADTTVYSFCGEIVLTGVANYHFLYRQGLNSMTIDSNAWWNSPEQLFPYMEETGKLFMSCSENITPRRDWRDYFEQEKAYDYRLEEVGRVNQYIFYEAVANVD